MQERLENFGGTGPTLLFAHANGFPPASYRAFIEPFLHAYRVLGFRQRPLWDEPNEAPLRANWSQFADDLTSTVRAGDLAPVWIMGHSMGAVVAMLASVREPNLFRGVILIDPVFKSSRFALGLRLLPDAKIQNVAIVRRALNRPGEFPDRAAAFTFHRGKRAFAKLTDEVLWDYINAGTRERGDGRVELVYTGAWEAAVYASVPMVWPQLLRLRLPTLGLRGETSDVLSAAALRRWRRMQPSAELATLPGGHLLPLEQPVATAAHVLDFLAKQRG